MVRGFVNHKPPTNQYQICYMIRLNKIRLLCVSLVSLSACTVYRNSPQNGVTFAQVGTNFKGLAVTDRGLAADEVDSVSGVQELVGGFKSYVMGNALKSVASTAGRTYRGVTASKEATKRVGLAEGGLTDRAGIAASVEKAKLATPNGL